MLIRALGPKILFQRGAAVLFSCYRTFPRCQHLGCGAVGGRLRSQFRVAVVRGVGIAVDDGVWGFFLVELLRTSIKHAS